MAENDAIRTRVVRNYRQFVAEVDPKGGIMDHLIEAGVVSIETKERVVSHVTRQDRCRAVLDELLGSSHRQAFIVLQRALRDHYPWIVDTLNQDSCDDIDSNGHHFTTPSVREMAKRLDDIEKNLRQSPTPNVERGLRRQIDDLKASEIQLRQQIDILTANDQKLANANYEPKLKSQELSDSDVKDQMEKLRQDFKAKEMELKVQLEESIERERLLKAKLDQAAIREKLLRQEVRQAVHDERMQLTSLNTADSILTSAASDQSILLASDDCINHAGSSSAEDQPLETLQSSSAAVYGIAILQDELYIARDRSNVIEVYDVNTPLHSCLRSLAVTVKPLFQQVRPLDIASCTKSLSLYISDAANSRLHRVEPASGRVVDTWRVDAQSWGVSVTARGTVIVCNRGAGLLSEYTSCGKLVRRVRLPDDVAQPVHAVELRSRFVVSHYDVDESNSAGARVCVVDDSGAVQREHTQLSQPHHLAAVSDDEWSLVVVADCGNNRIKLLDASTLDVVAMIGGSWNLRRPHRLCVHQGRLYVGQWDGRVLVYQLPPRLPATGTALRPSRTT